MSESAILRLTPEDLANRLNALGDPNLLAVGAAGYPEELALEKCVSWDDYVCSRAPEVYRRMLTRVEGEVLTDYALGGEQTFLLGLQPVTSGSVRLFLDWPRGRDYRERTAGDAVSPGAFSVALETGLVTLVAGLEIGARLYADYGHGAGGRLYYLREIALKLAAASVWEELAGMAGVNPERLDGLRRQAYSDLDRLRRREAGLQLFDDLRLVGEYETRNEDGSAEFPLAGGFL